MPGVEQVSCTLGKYCKPCGKVSMEILPPPMTSGRTGAVPATWVLGYGTRVPVSGLGMLRQKLCTAEVSTKIPFILSHSIFGALASANQFCSPQSLSQLFNLSPDQQKGFPFFLLSCFYSPTYIFAPANPVLLQQCLWEPGDIPTGMRFTPFPPPDCSLWFILGGPILAWTKFTNKPECSTCLGSKPALIGTNRTTSGKNPTGSLSRSRWKPYSY